jgi:hypothetical protein
MFPLVQSPLTGSSFALLGFAANSFPTRSQRRLRIFAMPNLDQKRPATGQYYASAFAPSDSQPQVFHRVVVEKDREGRMGGIRRGSGQRDFD